MYNETEGLLLKEGLSSRDSVSSKEGLLLKEGYVYCLTNISMPNLVKVGYTDVCPHRRSRELFTTGVPTPFTLEFYIKVFNAYTIEQNIHTQLEKKYERKLRREFFVCSTDDIIPLFSSYSDNIIYVDKQPKKEEITCLSQLFKDTLISDIIMVDKKNGYVYNNNYKIWFPIGKSSGDKSPSLSSWLSYVGVSNTYLKSMEKSIIKGYTFPNIMFNNLKYSQAVIVNEKRDHYIIDFTNKTRRLVEKEDYIVWEERPILIKGDLSPKGDLYPKEEKEEDLTTLFFNYTNEKKEEDFKEIVKSIVIYNNKKIYNEEYNIDVYPLSSFLIWMTRCLYNNNDSVYTIDLTNGILGGIKTNIDENKSIRVIEIKCNDSTNEKIVNNLVKTLGENYNIIVNRYTNKDIGKEYDKKMVGKVKKILEGEFLKVVLWSISV